MVQYNIPNYCNTRTWDDIKFYLSIELTAIDRPLSSRLVVNHIY